MIRLDELEGDHKLIEILDLDPQGKPTLYYDANIMNASQATLDSAPFRMNSDSTLVQVAAQGEEVECDYLQDDVFDWDSKVLVRSRYAAPLSEPVAPGEYLDLFTVTAMNPIRSARQLDDGRFRFRWTQFPTIRWAAEHPEIAVAYSQAIRLPQGSRLLKVHPLPAEIRTEIKTTLIWHSMLTQFGPFDCTIEYRVRPDWTEDQS